MRPYEFTMIVRPDLDEADTSAVLSRYEGKIGADGRIIRRDVWGTKRFAYPVKKFFRGYYVCYSIVASPKIVKDLERQIRFDNRVLRHIIIGVAEHEETLIKDSEETTPTEQPTVDNKDDETVAESSDEASPQVDQVPTPEEKPATDADSTDDTTETVEAGVSDADSVAEPASTSDNQQPVEPTEKSETADDQQLSEPSEESETADDQQPVEPSEKSETADDQQPSEPSEKSETADDQQLINEPTEKSETADDERPPET